MEVVTKIPRLHNHFHDLIMTFHDVCCFSWLLSHEKWSD